MAFLHYRAISGGENPITRSFFSLADRNAWIALDPDNRRKLVKKEQNREYRRAGK